jgi:hypothetical protein
MKMERPADRFSIVVNFFVPRLVKINSRPISTEETGNGD